MTTHQDPAGKSKAEQADHSKAAHADSCTAEHADNQKAPHGCMTKEERSMEIIRKYTWWSMGAGLIPVPFIDLIGVMGVQSKMVADISEVYGIKFSENRGKAIFGSLIGFVVPASFSFGSLGSFLKAIPLVGTLVGLPSMALFCGASAYALGKVFIQHFEAGGTFLDFEPETVREYFRTQFEEGKKVAAAMEATKGHHAKVEPQVQEAGKGK